MEIYEGVDSKFSKNKNKISKIYAQKSENENSLRIYELLSPFWNEHNFSNFEDILILFFEIKLKYIAVLFAFENFGLSQIFQFAFFYYKPWS